MKYNPFKMWGSYVIPVLAVIFFFFATNFCIGGNPMGGPGNCGRFNPLLFNFSLIVLILGFFIGWGVHSLVLSLMNKPKKKK